VQLSRNRRLIGASITLLVLGVVGFVYAAWVSPSGDTDGYAKATNAQAVTDLDASGSTTADLYPGFTNGDLVFAVHNPNPYKVQVTSVTRTGAAAITSDTAGCSGSNISIHDLSTQFQQFDVNGNSDSSDQTVQNVVSMGDNPADECQGATFTIPLKVESQSNAG
jgi:hypothetical protein